MRKVRLVLKPFLFRILQMVLVLLSKLAPYAKDLVIGMEATGHYWLSLYSFLYEKDFKIYVINPIQTDG